MYDQQNRGVRVPGNVTVLVFGWLLDVLTESNLCQCFHDVDLSQERRVVSIAFMDTNNPIPIPRLFPSKPSGVMEWSELKVIKR